MTHEEGVDYFDYVKEIAKNPLATKVKLADLEHNMDPTRLKEVTEADIQRTEKYKKAYFYLLETVDNKNESIENKQEQL